MHAVVYPAIITARYIRRVNLREQRSFAVGSAIWIGAKRSGEVGYFLVEVGEGGFEGFAVVGVGGVGEVVGDAGAGKLKIPDGLFAELLRRGFLGASGERFLRFGGFSYLGFYVFAFPTSGHVVIFAYNEGGGRDLSLGVHRQSRT